MSERREKDAITAPTSDEFVKRSTLSLHEWLYHMGDQPLPQRREGRPFVCTLNTLDDSFFYGEECHPCGITISIVKAFGKQLLSVCVCDMVGVAEKKREGKRDSTFANM